MVINELERYERTAARDIIRRLKAVGPPPDRDVRASPELRVKIMQRIEQLEASRVSFTKPKRF